MPVSLIKFLWHRPISFLAIVFLVILYSIAYFAPFLSPHDPNACHFEQRYAPPSSLVWENKHLNFINNEGNLTPLSWGIKGHMYSFLFFNCSTHLFGSKDPQQVFYLLGADAFGRDVFSRILYASRVSLGIALVGIILKCIISFFIGAYSGYKGGTFDLLCMRCIEFLQSVPTLYLLLCLHALLSTYFRQISALTLVLMLTGLRWGYTARLIRNTTLTLKTQEFILAAQAMGQSTIKILFRHIGPNVLTCLIVSATTSVPFYILSETTLSFLGLGIQEPSLSWGLLLQSLQTDFLVITQGYWWLYFPGILMIATVFAFNLIGDTLRDFSDIQTRS